MFKQNEYFEKMAFEVEEDPNLKQERHEMV